MHNMTYFKDYNNLSSNLYDNAYILRKKQLAEAMVGRSSIYPSSEPAFPKPSQTSYSNPQLQTPQLGNTGDNKPSVVPSNAPSGIGTFSTQNPQGLSPVSNAPLSSPNIAPSPKIQTKNVQTTAPTNIQTDSTPLSNEPTPIGMRGTGMGLRGEGGGVIASYPKAYERQLEPLASDIPNRFIENEPIRPFDLNKNLAPIATASTNTNYRPGFSNAPEKQKSSSERNQEIAERNRKRSGMGVDQMLNRGMQLAQQAGINPMGQIGSAGGLSPGAMFMQNRGVGYMNQANISGFRSSRGFV